MIKELTKNAYSILEVYHRQTLNNELSISEAQNNAIEVIKNLRYGSELKDYFWITDMHPIMIMHPYRSDLDSTDLSEFADPTGKKLFVEFVETVKNSDNAGYVDYMWQWKDDSTKIVPKLSYVKLFKPWNWVIGTGIYIEDVKAEISEMENNLIKISAIIIIIIVIILLIITLQSYKIEKLRNKTEEELKKSHEKYKTVVEDLNDGILLVVNGLIVYSNKIIQNFLGFNETELNNKYILDILSDEDKNQSTGIRYFKEIEKVNEKELKYEVYLKSKSGELKKVDLSIRKTDANNYSGYILKIKPLSERRKQISQEFYKFNQLTNNINLGVFRARITKHGKFLEANNAMVNILGFQHKEDLFNVEILSLFQDKNDRNEFISTLINSGQINNKLLKLKRHDGKIVYVSISAILILDEEGNPYYCDGIAEDITEKLKHEKSKDDLINELQSSLMFYNMPVKHFCKPLLTCYFKDSIKETAYKMSQQDKSSAIVVDEMNNQLGIITNHDFKERVISENISTDQPVFLIMSSPIISIPDNSFLFEAINIMIEKDISNIAIRDYNEKIISLLSFKDLTNVQRFSAGYHYKRLEKAKSLFDIKKIHDNTPRIVKTLIETGGDSKQLTKILTNVSDIITKKIIDIAINKHGEPPVKFSFMVLGSQGRNELTLATDQDNAIIYEDVDKPLKEQVQQYFLNLGKTICDLLNDTGYRYCSGKMMANNPKWNMSLSEWKNKFNSWVNKTEPQDILEINTFYDLRNIYGDNNIFQELRNFITNSLAKNDIFLFNLASYALKFKPPVNIFGNIIKTVVKDKKYFNIKESQMAFTIYVRYLSLKNNISETNTIERLNALYNLAVLQADEFKNLSQSYEYLILIRLKNQIHQIDNNQNPDNLIDIKLLTDIEYSMLKKIFSEISLFQEKLKLSFHGLID
ncbi:MAG: hypothetical protein Kow0068_00210 [Marinilabiliales bacterium]